MANQKASKSLSDSNNDVSVLSTANYEPAALALAEAFGVDDVARYLIDTPDRAHWSEQDKWNLHVDIFKYITYAHCMRGLVTTTGSDYGCVALWMPPHATMDGLSTFFMSGLWRLAYKLSWEGRRRFFKEFAPLLHSTKADVLGTREHLSYYLVYIGTKPSARGQGLARRLIEHVTLHKADLEGATCYLESSNVSNLQLYRKCGFEIVKQIRLRKVAGEETDGTLPLDIMVREPQRSRSIKENKPMKDFAAAQVADEAYASPLVKFTGGSIINGLHNPEKAVAGNAFGSEKTIDQKKLPNISIQSQSSIGNELKTYAMKKTDETMKGTAMVG